MAEGAIVKIGVTTAPVITAPAPIWLEAFPAGFTTRETGVTYDPDFHEVSCIWTIRGQPLSGGAPSRSVIAEWDNPNVAYGKRVAMCLSAPGRYTIDLVARDAFGGSAAAETTIVVQDPDEAYAGARTVCIALDSDFTGKPVGAVGVASLKAAEAFLRRASVPVRMLFKRGEEYSDVSIRADTKRRLTHVGVWGAGARPVIRPLRIDGNRGCFGWRQNHQEVQATVDGLEFRGDWDSTKESGINCDSPLDLKVFGISGMILTLHDCRVRGFNKGISVNFGYKSYERQRAMIASCDFSDWLNYGVYVQNGDITDHIAIVGNSIAQHPDALSGGGRKAMRYNLHGPIRISSVGTAYIARNHLFSKNGWFENGPGNLAEQACFRPNTNGLLGTTYVVERNVMEGGSEIIDANTADRGQPSNPWNALFDKNLFIATAKLRNSAIKLGHGGTTIRNSIMVVPDVRQYSAAGQTGLVYAAIENDQNGNHEEPVRIYNNSVLNLQKAASGSDPRARRWQIYATEPRKAVHFANVTEENNLLHGPDLANSLTDFAPIDTATAIPGVTPLWPGVRYGFEFFEGKIPPGGVSPGGSLTIPYAKLTDELVDNAVPGRPTDQAYWRAVPAADTRHMLRFKRRYFNAHAGEFTVSYDHPRYVLLTNTSGTDWPGGAKYRLKLDRHSMLPAGDVSRANPATVPLPRPLPGSSAIGTGDAGLRAYDDFFGTVRPPAGNAWGALSVL